ncbi:hypothetical protein ACUUMB_10365 [Enterobacter kobei]
MSKITKELAQSVSDLKAGYTLGHTDVAILNELARIALASLEAEAVALRDERSGSGGISKKTGFNDLPHGTPLYAAPPAPVSVPEPIKRNDADGWWMYKGRRVGGGCAEWYNRALDDCRAAMLQGAESDFREIVNSSTKHFRENAETSTKCWCRTCRPVTISDMRFVVCPDCGNKRCPHANDHRNACTGSNEPGQEGSAYPAAPQKEVK